VSVPETRSRLQQIEIPGPIGPLEALLQEHEGRAATLTALVLHPHPLYGGTMNNKVVHRVASTLHGLGAIVLRFNFRGVGASVGTHDQARGELDDARAALAFLRSRYPSARRWVSGFSFGSAIAARLASAEPDVERLILVAPPVLNHDFASMRTWAKPKLVLQGTNDDQCPMTALTPEFATWAEPKTLVTIEGATHFFDRQLAALGDALQKEVAAAAQGA